MKHLHHIPVFCFFGLLLIIFLVIPLSSPARFDNLCDDFFQEQMEGNSLTLHYTIENPENYDIDPDTISLGNYTSDTSAQKRWLLKKFYTLQTISKNILTESSRFTYDLLDYCIRTELDGLEFHLLEEPLVPSIGIQSQLPILLAEYSFYSEADVKTYLKLLSCIPDYFDSLLELEEEKCNAGLFMDQESASELIMYCQEFLSEPETHFLTETFQERLDTLQLSSDKNSDYSAQNRHLLETYIFPSYKKLEKFLTKHINDGTNENGLYYYPDGTDYYQWLIRSKVGCDRSFEEIEAMLESALKEDASIIAALTRDDPELLEKRQKITLDTSNPAGLTLYLSQRAKHDFPEIPEVSVEIRNVPASMEPHLSPAFYLVPALDRYDENIVYLNNGYLKEGISFFTTLAHESYPGHLYQTVYESTRLLHPVHRLLYFGGYTEGWATYAEQLSYFYAPLSENMAKLLSSARSMTLNLYSHLDLYVHAYGWTEEQCAAYLKKFGITTAASVHDMFLLVKQQPANYLKYYLGYLEICDLCKQAEELWNDDFTLRRFHEFILNYGPAPFSLMEQYLK